MGPANGGESIQAWRPLKHELLERAIPERPLLRVGAGIERMSKKVRRKLVLGRRPILKKFESGSRRWHLNNPGKNAKRSREWRKKHPKNSTRYFAERRRSDGTFRLITNLRTRINLALSRQNKLDSTIALLGCSARFYKKYISGLFLPGMSWEARNFEIDHIQPISSFDLATLEGQKAAFNYRNTQPLFRADNLRKGGKPRLRDSLKARPSP